MVKIPLHHPTINYTTFLPIHYSSDGLPVFDGFIIPRRVAYFRRYTTAYDGIAYDGSDGIITTAMARIYDGNNQALRRGIYDGSDDKTRRGYSGIKVLT